MDDLVNEAKKIAGVDISPEQLQTFKTYARTLKEWNAHINLTAIREPEQVRVKHFLDSLTCLRVMRGTPMQRVADVGTGAGFPGLVLKTMHPEMQLTLVESVAKKANFCLHVIETLGLENVEMLTGRAELVGKMPEHREQYDWALARAVASLPVLAEYLLPLLRVGGRMLAQMGFSAPAEVETTQPVFEMLGGRLRELVPVALPGLDETRYLIVVDKVAPTPKRYPRRVGIPKKRPLTA